MYIVNDTHFQVGTNFQAICTKHYFYYTTYINVTLYITMWISVRDKVLTFFEIMSCLVITVETSAALMRLFYECNCFITHFR